FILAHMGDRRDGSLFPADPFMRWTNSLSLGFGACGILYVLKKCGFEIPQYAYDWLNRKLDALKPETLPPGLLTGSAGVAWCTWELGLEDRATAVLNMANESRLLHDHHSYLYGLAGVGLANLYFYAKTQRSEYLERATELAHCLLASAQDDDRGGIFWERNDIVHLGFGYGQSGVALFLLRLYQMSGDNKYLSEGRRAMKYDLSEGIEAEPNVVSFPGDLIERTTLEPYLEEGSAGIAKTAIRYGIWDGMDQILRDTHRKYAIAAG